MPDILIFLMPPIAVCVISALLFGYFGLHVLQRGVIFVDIALAQVAALGALTGMFCGIGHGSDWLAVVSLLAVTAASLLFATVNFNSNGLPQEGLIGVVYCLSLAACLFIAEFVPDGSGFVKESLTGSLLWVTWGKVARLAIICTAVGAFHLVFRRKYIRPDTKISTPEDGIGKFWEFTFYFSLGLVIVEAVGVLGVFLVFSLLVVPASVGLMFCRSWTSRLIVSWIVGISVSLAGILAADRWNLPTAPMIVVILGTLLILAAITCFLFRRSPVQSTKSAGPLYTRTLEAE